MFQLSAYATLFDLLGYGVPGAAMVYFVHVTRTGLTSGSSLLASFDPGSAAFAGVALLVVSFLVGMSVCSIWGGNVRRGMRFVYGNPNVLPYPAPRAPLSQRFLNWFSDGFRHVVREVCTADFGPTNGEEAYRLCRSTIRTALPQSDFDIERHVAVRSACYNLTACAIPMATAALRLGHPLWLAVLLSATVFTLLAYRAVLFDWLQAERVYTSYLALRRGHTHHLGSAS